VSTAKVDAFLGRHRRIALDSSVVIYAIEGSPKYFDVAARVFQWIQDRNGDAVTSTITMVEALVRPYRLAAGARAREFHALLVTYPHLRWIEPTIEIAIEAARIRAAYNLCTPDAIQAATATVARAGGLVTNDPIFRRVPSVEALILDELL